MEFRNPEAQLYVPDGAQPAIALSRTTHLAVGAHQDDIPIMAYDGILKCYDSDDSWFSGITVTDGAGSPRSGRYADYSDEQMRKVRTVEENTAAAIGRYAAAIQLDYPSSAVKDSALSDEVTEELAQLIAAASPQVVYTHNLADKHDTHVAVALRTVAAIRLLPPRERPPALYGCEVWRDLDWMNDEDKVFFDVSSAGDLSAALLGAYDSQIAGGKRYDLATEGRRLAHATYSASHAVDTATALIYGMDLTALITDTDADVTAHVTGHIERMKQENSNRIGRLS